MLKLVYVGLILVLSLFTISDAIAYKCRWDGRYEVIVRVGEKKKIPAIIELNFLENCNSFRGKMMTTSGSLIYKLKGKSYGVGLGVGTGISFTLFKGEAEEVYIPNRLNLKPHPRRHIFIKSKKLSIKLFSNPFGKITGSIGTKIKFEGVKE